MEPTPKAEPLTKFLETSFKRSSSIESLKCVPKPIGCGRQIDPGEIEVWDPLTIQEYRISGLCNTCQDEIFDDEREDAVAEERPMMDNLYDVYAPFRQGDPEPRHIFDTSTGRAPEDDWDS